MQSLLIHHLIFERPIVNKPSEAIRCFSGTGIDFLALGTF